MKNLSLTKLETDIVSQFQQLAILDYIAFSTSSYQPDELFITQIQQWYNQPFEAVITQLKESNNWNNYTTNQLKELANTQTIVANNTHYDHFNYQDLNTVLENNGSNLRIQWSMQSSSREFVVGLVKQDTIDEFQIFKVHKQLCSSFGLFIPMVAMINNNDIMLREACIDKMIELKWMPILTHLKEYIQLESMLANELPNYIGTKLRNATLKLYSNSKDFNTEFKRDCEENVLYHEFGHAVIQNHCIASPYAAIAETFQVFSEDNMMILCLEILADLAPKKQNKKGILTHLFSLQDSLKAQRCLTMYFADIWFFDTQETHMYNYSEILAVLFIKYSIKNKEEFLNDFSLNKSSKLQKIIEVVVSMVDEFRALFITDDQFNRVASHVDYVEQTKCSQKILQEVKSKKNDEIMAFLNSQLSIIKELYIILDASYLYNDSAQIRRDNLFKQLVRVLT